MNDLENIHNLLVFMEQMPVKGKVQCIAYNNAIVYLETKFQELGGSEEHKKQLEESKKQ